MTVRNPLALACCLIASTWAFDEPATPTWPSTVKVFGPEDSTTTIEKAVNAAYEVNGGQQPENHGQFSDKRFAFLFKPGSYEAEVPVGFYTQVAGLGTSPSDVKFTSSRGVFCQEGSFNNEHGALETFWRMAENFQTDASFSWNGGKPGMLWAVSQAAPLRNVIVSQDLSLYQYVSGRIAGYASGGFMANVEVKGTTISGSQQQFITRNSKLGPWNNGVWNMVFVGNEGAPTSHCGCITGNPDAQPYVTVDSTPVIAEKPFISIGSGGEYYLNVPAAQRNRVGTDHAGNGNAQIPFSQVFVADASKDNAKTINAKLSAGKHVVLSPGIYNLDAPLMVNKANQVVLGLGLATLVSSNGNAVIKVGNVDGVRIASVLLQAGDAATDVLMQWGQGSYKGNADSPGFIHDLFARVGGPSDSKNPQAKVMLEINSGHVVGDNLWLWRADHTASGEAPPGSCANDHGLVVNGDDVTMYGLAAEHSLQDIVQWNGQRGATYFFQAEMPYDVDQSYGDKGYVGYRVADNVTQHAGYGVGVYHFFRDNPVIVKSGIACPEALEASFVSPLAVFLNGKGVMQHILNDKGATTRKSGQGADAQWLCGEPGPPPSPPSPPSPPTPPPSPPTPPPSPTPPTPPPPSPFSCKVGDTVPCDPNGDPDFQQMCAGDQCCPGGFTCPSAHNTYKGCPKAKKANCVHDELIV